MHMVLGVIAFLLTLIFISKGIVDIFRRRNFRKSFSISFLSFVILIFAITHYEPTETSEVARQDTKQTEVKKDKEDKKVSQNDTETKEVTKDNSAQPTEKPIAPTPKVVAHGVKVNVTRVVDGDTIHVLMNGKDETIRTLLLDTPETVDPNKPIQPFGKEASNFANQVLFGKTVEIQVGSEERDKYGRLLAYVWIGDKTYQEMALEQGLGSTAYLYNDLTMLDQFHKAQQIAIDKRIGVWSIDGYAHVDHDHGFHYQEKKTEAQPTPAPAAQPKQATPTPTPSTQPETEFFKNCTEVRTKYPNGVPSTHPAYQSNMDRDHDNYACEQ